MTKITAQKRLTALWFISSALLAVLFIAFTVLNRFGPHDTEAWQWYSQNIVPTLTLIVGSFYAAATQEEATSPPVDIFYYRVCYYISLFYLLALFATVLAAPFAQNVAQLTMLDLLNNSKIYLTVFQGLVSCSLGVFFVKSIAPKQG